ncbi:hypothetical protein GCM10011574_23690 [Microbispora bryophytorum]|uniref:Uncharacterized protein n=1 Tax=Microbispora bryophytorum TaxID=1460882 RepID=A0A8H9LFW3_9ACTN|nr:hypothetical protein GCM10011574_23690 [Microbispora bryophytorum]
MPGAGRKALSGGRFVAAGLATMTVPWALTSWTRLTVPEAEAGSGSAPARTCAVHWVATCSAAENTWSSIRYRIARSRLTPPRAVSRSNSIVTAVV